MLLPSLDPLVAPLPPSCLWGENLEQTLLSYPCQARWHRQPAAAPPWLCLCGSLQALCWPAGQGGAHPAESGPLPL
uniref:Macaca fascicularis brain cDNA clone: QorA-10641, similar to human WD repeat domain 8 (WDR8), mRNA, RefSeq: NM_017818.2 n=1 Tax=Macaca fascicularis TaxID=9541 RepID=I7GJZ8_MACFA|nr:unnamed protein product [Macaca fascicularis]